MTSRLPPNFFASGETNLPHPECYAGSRGLLAIIIVARLLKEVWKGFFGRNASGAVESSANAAQLCPEISVCLGRVARGGPNSSALQLDKSAQAMRFESPAKFSGIHKSKG